MPDARSNARCIALTMLQAIHVRTQRTNATDARIQDLEKIVQLLTARVGLWISRFSALKVTS